MKRTLRGFTLHELLVVITMGISLAGVIALVIVAAHFISKFW